MGVGLRRRRVAACGVLVAACLGVGAVLNVAVAWGLAIREARAVLVAASRPPPLTASSPFYTHARPAPLRWVAPVPTSWPETPGESNTHLAFGSDWTVAFRRIQHGQPADSVGYSGEYLFTDKQTYGVPLRSVVRWSRWEYRTPASNTVVSASSPELPAAWIERVCGATTLPIVPLWPGFALNTIFYAALAWGAWRVPLALRRRARCRAGKCAACGYSLAGLTAGSPCPECGGK